MATNTQDSVTPDLAQLLPPGAIPVANCRSDRLVVRALLRRVN